MDWHVSEPYSPYDYIQQCAPYPSFDIWDALTGAEREALTSFQDLGSMQDVWDVEAPDESHVNCSIINSYLRFPGFREMMSAEDIHLCDSLICSLDSAIEKSVLPVRLNVIRGLFDASWTENLAVGDEYVEEGYGSYSLSPGLASGYAGVNADGRLVFFARYLDVGDTGLYLGSKEEEILVGRGKRYLVKEIDIVAKGRLSSSHEAIVYMLVEV